MRVIVANDPRDAIRGMLKRWFIESHPDVFVGTLNPRRHQKTSEYIKRQADRNHRSTNEKAIEVSVSGCQREMG